MAPNLQTNPSKRHRILLSCAASKKPRQENDNAAAADVSFGVKDLRSRRIFGEKRCVFGDSGFQIEDPKKLGSVEMGSDRDGENESKRKLGDFKGDEDVGIEPRKDSGSGYNLKLVPKESIIQSLGLDRNGENEFKQKLGDFKGDEDVGIGPIKDSASGYNLKLGDFKGDEDVGIGQRKDSASEYKLDSKKPSSVVLGLDKNGENESKRKLGNFKGDEDAGIGQRRDSASGYKLAFLHSIIERNSNLFDEFKQKLVPKESIIQSLGLDRNGENEFKQKLGDFKGDEDVGIGQRKDSASGYKLALHHSIIERNSSNLFDEFKLKSVPKESIIQSLGLDRNGENEFNQKLGDFKGDEDVGIGPRRDLASGYKLVVKASFSKKVFKVPGSNSYRRLLPFLMNMAKGDAHSLSELPCIPKAEENGLGTINSNGTEHELPEVIGNLSLSNDEDQSAHSDGLKILESEEIKNSPTELSCETKHFDVLSLPKTQGVAQLHGDQKGIKNSKSLDEADEYAEELAVSNINAMDLGVSLKVLNSIGTNPMNSCTVNSKDPEGEAEGIDCANPLENGEMNNHLSCEAPDIDHLNLSGIEEGVLLDNEDQKSNENGGSSNGADEYGENIQTTPPDMDISNLEMNTVENEENQKRKIAIANDSFTCGTTSKEDICLKNGSNSNKKVILNPCSRRKIFKTPGSFSYRRLLPYLNDVSGDNLHYTLDASKHPPRPKAKIYSEEKKPTKDLHMVDLNSQQIPVSKYEASYSSTEHAEGDSELDPPNFAFDSSDDKFPLTSAEKSNELQKPFDSPDKCMIPLEQVISNIIKSLEPDSGGEIFKTEIASSDFKLCSSGDNKTTHRYDAHVVSHSESNSSQAKTARDSLLEESFSENPGNNSKGILKRNPRGCRGLCSCLNCTSFRLHADRAFEFSRNQMLDAEELALYLIKEMAGLRNMLKESTVNSQGQTTTNIDQVMAACSNALKVEESAKCRLKEMRCDLSVHCRSKLLERPRVRFANHVNEMVIPEVESPAGDEKSKK